MERQSILSGYSDREKGAYLGAIASIATADRAATQDELEHLTAMSEAAELTPPQEAAVVRAASEISSDELQRCLEILKDSELKYSLIADIITFAKVDGKYNDEEKASIEKIAKFLGVNQNQFSLLDEFVDKTAKNESSPEEIRNPHFFDALGLRNPMEKSGINVNALSRGLLGMVGPAVLAGLASSALRRHGGFNTPFDRSRMPIGSRGFGGLGSVFSMLNRRGNYRGLGGMLPGLFG